MGTGIALPLWPLYSYTRIIWMLFKAKVRIRTGMESLCRRLRSRSATLALLAELRDATHAYKPMHRDSDHVFQVTYQISPE